MKITTYNLHGSAPSSRALVALHAQLYRDSGAEAVMKSTGATRFFRRTPFVRGVAQWRDRGVMFASAQLDGIISMTHNKVRDYDLKQLPAATRLTDKTSLPTSRRRFTT